MAKNDMLVAWLNDTYAMEQSQLKMLKRFVDDYEEFPDIQAKLREHYEQTERQAEDIKTCIEGLDGKVSTAKSAMGNIMGTMQGIGTSVYKDEVVKDMIMLHAGEHFEHASYLALAAGAEASGEGEIAAVCRRILDEEKAMAEWTEEQLPLVAQVIVEREFESDDDD